MPQRWLMDRVLRGGSGTLRFAAAAGPHGLHIVQYARDRHGLEILGGVRQASGGDADMLATALADAVEALGGRGGTLDVAISGYGSAHHILTLPAAEADVLAVVVRRELSRYYPDLRDPVIGYGIGAGVLGDASKRELLVGAVPRRLGERLHAGLRERGIELRHLTVHPQAMHRLYDAFDGGTGPTVLLLLPETGPLIGCFHEGWLRLFIEPPLDIHGRPIRAAAAVAEQVERASLFLRQQFPSAPRARVLLAAAGGEYPAVQSELETQLEAAVERLAEAPAGSLAALGAALDAESAEPLTLLPEALRPRSAAESWTRGLSIAAAGVLTLAAVWWAGSAVVLARSEAARARALEVRVESRLPWLAQTREVLEGRRAHVERLLFLERTQASRDEARMILAGVAAVAGPSVRLERLQVQRAGDGWWVSVHGVAGGAGSAAAVRAVDAVFRGVPERLPVSSVELGEMETVPDAPGYPVAIAFDMSFIVRWESDLRR